MARPGDYFMEFEEQKPKGGPQARPEESLERTPKHDQVFFDDSQLFYQICRRNKDEPGSLKDKISGLVIEIGRYRQSAIKSVERLPLPEELSAQMNQTKDPEEARLMEEGFRSSKMTEVIWLS